MLTQLRAKPKETPRRKRVGPIRARLADELAPLESHWPIAAEQSASPAPSFAWLEAARTAFSESNELKVVAAERDGEILAASAVVCTRHGPTWRWQPLGSELGEPTDFAGSDPQAVASVARSLVNLGMPVLVQRMPADSSAIAAVRWAARGRALVVSRQAEPEYGIALDESWVHPQRHLSAAEGRQLARARREAERQGGLSTEIHAPDLRDLPGLLDHVFQCDGPTRSSDEELIAQRMSEAVFFRHYCEAACKSGILRIALVRIADRVAAATIAIDNGSTLWLLRIACNPRFEVCQPGQLIVREMLGYCAEAGIRRCTVWGQQHAWLRVWPTSERPCLRLQIYPLTISGAAAAAIDGAEGLFQRAARFLRG